MCQVEFCGRSTVCINLAIITGFFQWLVWIWIYSRIFHNQMKKVVKELEFCIVFRFDEKDLYQYTNVVTNFERSRCTAFLQLFRSRSYEKNLSNELFVWNSVSFQFDEKKSEIFFLDFLQKLRKSRQMTKIPCFDLTEKKI